jgi:hypothetical protein
MNDADRDARAGGRRQRLTARAAGSGARRAGVGARIRERTSPRSRRPRAETPRGGHPGVLRPQTLEAGRHRTGRRITNWKGPWPTVAHPGDRAIAAGRGGLPGRCPHQAAVPTRSPAWRHPRFIQHANARFVSLDMGTRAGPAAAHVLTRISASGRAGRAAMTLPPGRRWRLRTRFRETSSAGSSACGAPG